MTEKLIRNVMYICGEKHTNCRINLRIVSLFNILCEKKTKSPCNCQCRPATSDLLEISSERNVWKCKHNVPVILLCDVIRKKNA